MMSYAKRAKARNTVTYSKLKDIWTNSPLNTDINYGNTGYLIRECIANLKEKNLSSMKRAEWAQYYLTSGQMRKKNSPASTLGNSEDIYYGRTLEDLYSISESFFKEVKEKAPGMKIDVNQILNFIYSEIVDNAYRTFVFISKINITLKEKYPMYSFKVSAPYDYLNNGIDILISKDGIESGAIRLLYNNQDESSLDEIDRQKAKLFSECNFMPVMYLTLDYNGDPVNIKLPLA